MLSTRVDKTRLLLCAAVYACFASSLIVTATAPIVNTPPAITNRLRLFFLDFEPPPALVALSMMSFVAAFVVSTVVAKLRPQDALEKLASTFCRRGIACCCDFEHARHVQGGIAPPRRSKGAKEANVVIIAW